MASIWTKDGAVWLLVNMVSTVAALYIAINLFSEISGAHFNPVVSFLIALSRGISWREFFEYLAAQFIGAIVGATLAQALFNSPILVLSSIDRSGLNIFGAETLASFGLVLIAIASWRYFETQQRAILIVLWIASAYFFTSSTSFANPAVSFGRIFTDSLAGISPSSFLLFTLAQVVGGLLAFAFNRYLTREVRK
jgi:glycerol uptake facilitator-like aquaporin